MSFLSLLAFVAMSAPAVAEPYVRVSADDSTVPLVPRSILFDPDGNLSPLQALEKLKADDTPEETSVYSHGYIPDTLWARIVLDIAPEVEGQWYLSLELPNFDRLQVFSVPQTGTPVQLTELGDKTKPQSEIRTRFHIAPVQLVPGRTELLVRGRTASTMTLDLKLRELGALLSEEQDFFALQTFYLGVAMIFAASSVGLLLFTRQAIYLIYFLNLIAHTFVWLLINGTGPGHLWPEFAASHSIDPHFFLAMTVAGTAAFAAMFLSTARVPRLIRATIWGIAVAGLGLMLLCLLIPEDLRYWANKVTSTIALPGASALIALTAVGLFRGEPAARPLMLTWIGLIAAVAMAILRDIGAIPSNVFTLTGAQLGSVFEMVVFAYMLLHRIGQLQREQERTQRDALTAAREYESVLESRVAERTSKLYAAIARERDARRLQQQFVSMVSHEFRNPLAIIDSAAQNVLTRDAGDMGRLEKIRSAVRRLRRMIDTCLIDERIRGGQMHLQPERFEICEMVEDVAVMLKAASDDRPFDLDLPDAPVMVVADRQLVEVALTNLLDNATKYSPSGSAVAVRVARDRDAAEITVSDQGMGVPESERERIFERYYRATNSPGSGAGLGLYLVRSILTAHKGSVSCLSESTDGARFRVRLPAEPTHEKSEAV